MVALKFLSCIGLYLFLVGTLQAQSPLPGSNQGKGPSITWERLKIGSGGYHIGMDIAADGTRVTRTDVSGAYIWPPGATQWTQCLTAERMAGTTAASAGLGSGAWEFVLAPSNGKRAYMLYAPGVFQGTGTTRFYRTDNQCGSFAELKGYTTFTSGANAGGKFSNQKIVVDPQNPDVVYVTSGQNGVFRSLDAGVTLAKMTSIPDAGAVQGNAGMVIDCSAGTTTVAGQTVCKNVYIPSFGRGIWASGDGGASFRQIAGQPPTMTTNFTTTANNVVVVASIQAFAGKSLVSISGGNLKWTCPLNNSAASTGWVMSMCWAIAPTPLANVPITATFSNTTTTADFPLIRLIGIAGANTAAPFDTNASLRFAPGAAPTRVSTSNTDTIILTSQIPLYAPKGPAGWNCLSCGPSSYFSYQVFSSPQSNISIVPDGGTTSRGGWTQAIRAESPGSLNVEVLNYVTTGKLDPVTTPTNVIRGAAGCDGTYYAIEGAGGGGTKGWVWDGKSWTDLNSTSGYRISDIAPHPKDCARILASDGNRFTRLIESRNKGIAGSWGKFHLTTTAGSGFSVNTGSPEIGWYKPYANPMNSLDAGNWKWNPSTLELEMATGYCYYKAKVPNQLSRFVYTVMCQGAETVVPFLLTSIPGGATFFSNSDVGMFVNLNSSTYPMNTVPKGNYIAGLVRCMDIQYSGRNPNFIVAICSEQGGFDNSGFTTTGGTSQAAWSQFGLVNNLSRPSVVPPGSGGDQSGSIAPNACDTSNVLWAQALYNGSGGAIYRTTSAQSGSISWTQIPQSSFEGAPTTGNLGWGMSNYYNYRHILVADKVDCDTFYAYNRLAKNTPNPALGALYKSTDKGVTWTKIYQGPITNEQTGLNIQSVHGKSGWLYAISGQFLGMPGPVAGARMMLSRDGGKSWNACPQIEEPTSFSLGAPNPSNPSAGPSILAIGHMNKIDRQRLFRSTDDCQTWTELTFAQPDGDTWLQVPTHIGADANNPNVIYYGLGPGAGWIKGTLGLP